MTRESCREKYRRKLAARNTYVTTQVIKHTTVLKTDEVEIVLTPQLEARLDVTRKELQFLVMLRKEKASRVKELIRDKDWNIEHEDTEHTSKFDKVYQHYISFDEWQESHRNNSQLDQDIDTFVKSLLKTKYPDGMPEDNDELSVTVMEMVNDIYKNYLVNHMQYLDDKIERYTEILAELKLEREFNEMTAAVKFVKKEDLEDLVKEKIVIEEEKENKPIQQ